MPEDDVSAVQARAQAYAAVHAGQGWWATKTACDLYVAAFLAPKIAALKTTAPESRERRLYDEFEVAKRLAEAASLFVRVPAEGGGRFPLTGRGDVNTYALFAELFSRLVGPRGRAGMIVPTGVATDATTAPFFGALIVDNRLA